MMDGSRTVEDAISIREVRPQFSSARTVRQCGEGDGAAQRRACAMSIDEDGNTAFVRRVPASLSIVARRLTAYGPGASLVLNER
jgi:hypothetical protein